MFIDTKNGVQSALCFEGFNSLQDLWHHYQYWNKKRGNLTKTQRKVFNTNLFQQSPEKLRKVFGNIPNCFSASGKVCCCLLIIQKSDLWNMKQIWKYSLSYTHDKIINLKVQRFIRNRKMLISGDGNILQRKEKMLFFANNYFLVGVNFKEEWSP